MLAPFYGVRGGFVLNLRESPDRGCGCGCFTLGRFLADCFPIGSLDGRRFHCEHSANDPQPNEGSKNRGECCEVLAGKRSPGACMFDFQAHTKEVLTE